MSSPFLTVWAELRYCIFGMSQLIGSEIANSSLWSCTEASNQTLRLSGGWDRDCVPSCNYCWQQGRKGGSYATAASGSKECTYHKKKNIEVRTEETCREYPLLMYSHSHTEGCHSMTLAAFLPQMAHLMPLISLPSHAPPFSKKDLINSLWKKTCTIQSGLPHFLTLSFLHLSYKPLYHPPHTYSGVICSQTTPQA